MPTFYKDDVDRWVEENGETDATDLAMEHSEAAIKKLASAARAFDKAFQEIRGSFPDAEIYSANDGLTLLLGPSHDKDCRAQQGRAVHIQKWPTMGYISGGDW